MRQGIDDSIDRVGQPEVGVATASSARNLGASWPFVVVAPARAAAQQPARKVLQPQLLTPLGLLACVNGGVVFIEDLRMRSSGDEC